MHFLTDKSSAILATCKMCVSFSIDLIASFNRNSEFFWSELGFDSKTGHHRMGGHACPPPVSRTKVNNKA